MSNSGLTNEQTMAGILAMLAVMREDTLAQGKDAEPRKTEVVLSDAGIPNPQIATLLGKKLDTVQKIILRTRKSTVQNSKETKDAK